MSNHSLLSLHVWLMIRRLSEEGMPLPKDAKVGEQLMYGMLIQCNSELSL
jgi:hypothetical protein